MKVKVQYYSKFIDEWVESTMTYRLTDTCESVDKSEITDSFIIDTVLNIIRTHQTANNIRYRILIDDRSIEFDYENLWILETML